MRSKTDKKNSQNLAEEAYLRIKDMIFQHQIFPGQKLIYRELAKPLGMSLTPVQFALGRLEQEGFVERISNVGYYVTKISLKEIEDLFDVRMILEVHAVELAIRNQTPEDIMLLEKRLQDHKNYSIQVYDRRKLMLDAAFHSQIAAMSGNLEIVRELKRIFEHTRLRSPVELIPPTRMNVATSEHEQILQMIKERDVSGATQYMLKHIYEAKEARIAMLAALTSMNMPSGNT
jgi:DNA-binding GntR family transcriptional regulator